MLPRSARDGSTETSSVSGAAALRLLAAGMFGLSVPASAFAASITSAIGIGLLLWSLRSTTRWSESVMRVCVGLIGIISLFVGMVTGIVGFPQPSQGFPLAFAVASAAVCALFVLGRKNMDIAAIVIAGVFLVVAGALVVATYPGERVGIDVYQSHESAADAIRSGANPYSDAVLVQNGSPLAEDGELIEGYSYPPVTLAAYASSSLILGDSRWASVLGVAVGLTMLALGVRSSSPVVAGAAVLLVAMPLQRAVIWSGWTEPLTMALVLSGLVAWRRSATSGVLIGLALATKQYMVVLVPLLWFFESSPKRRTVIGLAVAGGSLVPFALSDFSLMRSILIDRPLGLGFRPDSQSLAGMLGEQPIPTFVVVAVAIGLAAWLGSSGRSVDQLLASAAITLGFVFLFSLAFPNYWWLLQWLAVGSAVFAARPTDDQLEPGATQTDGGRSA